MSIDPRIIQIVELAKKLKPELFATEQKKTITANKGPNEELGYTIFFNKGTGYDYSLIAFIEGLFLCFKKTESVERNETKLKKANFFHEKYQTILRSENIVKKKKTHGIDNKPYQEWQVKVTSWDDEEIVNYMSKLAS